ncbi:hypothetical protein EI94DRAFT_1721394, partial [Lactarius quietus]
MPMFGRATRSHTKMPQSFSSPRSSPTSVRVEGTDSWAPCKSGNKCFFETTPTPSNPNRIYGTGHIACKFTRYPFESTVLPGRSL